MEIDAAAVVFKDWGGQKMIYIYQHGGEHY
jgi:hypothetical protein